MKERTACEEPQTHLRYCRGALPFLGKIEPQVGNNLQEVEKEEGHHNDQSRLYSRGGSSGSDLRITKYGCIVFIRHY